MTLLLLLLGVGASAAALHLTWRRLAGISVQRARVLLALRAVLLALLLAAVLNPTLPRVAQRPVALPVAVAMDVSRSMTELPLEGKRRHALALEALRSGALGERLRTAAVELYAVGEGAERVAGLKPRPPDRQADATDLQASLSEILRQSRREPLVACLLVSDGADTTGEVPARIAEILGAYGLPVFCLGVGSSRPVPDVAIAGLVYPRTVKEGDEIKVRARVSTPAFEQRELEVTLTPDIGGTIRAKLPAGAHDRRIELSTTASTPGYRRYVLAVEEVEGEVTAANNRRAFFVRVEPRQARLLLIEGRPRREYAFLRRLLLRIPDLETVILLRKQRPAQFWLDAEEPRRAAAGLSAAGELRRFRAVLLSNVDATALGGDFLRRLTDFVHEGGGLAMLGGRDAFGAGGYADGPLAEMLPVRMQGGGLLDNPVRVRLRAEGELGRTLRDTGIEGWERLPFLRGMNATGGPTTGAEVPLEATDGSAGLGPVLATGRAGAGRVLALTVADTYRWQQSPNAGERSRAAYEALWGAIIGWLSTPRAEKQVALELDRDVYEAGGVIRARVHVLDESYEPVSGARVELRIEGPGGSATHLAQATEQAGTYQVLLPAEVEGSYRATARASLQGAGIGADSAGFEVVAAIRELAQGRARPEVLEAIAEATGGKYLPIERAAEMAELLPLGERLEPQHTELRPARTALFFLLVLAVAAADWALRRRWGIG